MRQALPLAILLLVAASAHAEGRALRISAHDDGGHGGWFALDGDERRDPTLTLTPGEIADVTFTNRGSVDHNLHVGSPISALTRLVAPGASAQLRIEVPSNATGEAAYWCDPHKALGMRGSVAFVTAAPASPSPAPAVASGPPSPDRHATPLGPGAIGALALAAIAAHHRNTLEARRR